MIPIRTDSRLRTTPWANYCIIAANILVFIVQQRFHRLEDMWDLSPRQPHLLNFFTYSLLHANAMHIFGNMLFLFIFGNNVNDKMGNFAYTIYYLSAGVFAGICFALSSTPVPIIGASGAVAGVTGAYICLFPRANVTILYFFFYIGVIELPSLWVIAFYFAQDLFLNFSATPDNVAHIAHIGGTLFGFSLCFVLLMANLLPRDHFDVVALAKQWNRRRQFRDITSKGYDPFGYSSRLAPEKRLPQPMTAAQEKVQDLKSQISEALSRHDLPRGAELYVQMKQIDAEVVLSRQAQLDIANQLASQQQYRQAAEAYEMFLRYYKGFEQVEQVELMLGLIYARYLNRYPSAKEYLLRAMARLHGERELTLARSELARIEPLLQS